MPMKMNLKMKLIKKRAGQLLQIMCFFLLYPFARLIYRKRTIYLFMERGLDARDNAYYMFRYFRVNHPELECYYVIDPDSPDCARVQEYGETVAYRSLRHWLLYIVAKYRISTHFYGCAPYLNIYQKFSWLKKSRQIFLQHGVIKDDIEALYQKRMKVDIFICGAKPEYDYVASKFHYTHGEVKYTGLARYDGLQSFELKRQILLMPTWRIYLRDAGRKEFCSSTYFLHWNDVLNDERLKDYLKRADLKLVFYPHFEIQKYVDCFKTGSDRIIIADFAHYDVQSLLKESMLLVTDFSSVYFDFAYMRKPCIYYQFDEEEFFAEHYHKGYFDYRRMGFGPVCTDHDSCIEAIIKLIENGCTVDAEYYERMIDFFPLHDGRNCERIFREIEAL